MPPVRSLLAGLLALVAFALCAPSEARAWAWGDTLTTIWKPLPNLPALVRPGDTLNVWANAPTWAVGWSANLLYGDYAVDLLPAGGGYDAAKGRWELRFRVPLGTQEEVFDLLVTSSSSDPDVSRHAVKVLPAFRSTYYFAQISDTHLPEHTFSTPGGGFSTADTSAFPDFNAVASDLNLIHPEFILHTGDLVNEGELEDWLAMYEMSRAKDALSRLRDPVFVVPGNHDIGGWQASPPPEGTARRNWWKLFGWPYLDSPPPGDPVHSQNYAFDYGTLHVVGLETYVNYSPWGYDNFRNALYGVQSLSTEQVSWLSSHLAAVPPGRQKLLFYHYDFGGTSAGNTPNPAFSQINPAALGVDGAVWGHNHGVAEGNRTAKPFNLGLQAVIDGRRTFRLFRVSNGVITPGPMHHAGGTASAPTDSLTLAWNAANDGTQSSLTATMTNRYGEPWEHARLVFHMQPGLGVYTAANGTIAQQFDHDGMHDVEVDFVAPASGTIQVSVVGSGTIDAPPGAPEPGVRLERPSPNPLVRGSVSAVAYFLPAAAEAELAVFDATGRRVITLVRGEVGAGPQVAQWDGRDEAGNAAPAGLYLVRLRTSGITRSVKLALVR
jgi:hypothetical protein